MSNVAGYYDGKPACAHQLAWLPVANAEARRLGIVRQKLDIAQLIGGAPQSGGTHFTGGVADFWQTAAAFVRWCRQAGARATWYRPPNWDGKGGDPHTHSVLDCPCNKAARYQQDAVDDGYNGLGLMGRGGRDTGPRPLVKRKWNQGIKWAAGQVYADKKRTVKHAAKKYVVNGGKLAGRSYPGVGPVLVRRPKGFKIAATATYTAPDGTKHVRTKYGTWYALAYLTAVTPAKPKPAPSTGKVVQHTDRPKLGAKVADVMTWNLGILNAVGKARWPLVRKSVAKVIVANKLDVLFLQETPAAAAKWLAEATGMRRIGGHARPIFLRKGIEVLGWQIWTPDAKAKGGKDKPVVFARVVLNGTETLLVNCHPQAEQRYTTVRSAWAVEVIDEAERRAKVRGGIPIVFAGDMQLGEFASKAKPRGFRRSIETAHRVVNGHMKSFNKRSTKPVEGYQLDQVISDLVASEHRLIWNGRLGDHNRVRATLHLPA